MRDEDEFCFDIGCQNGTRVVQTVGGRWRVKIRILATV
jgi:hypothetical protein